MQRYTRMHARGAHVSDCVLNPLRRTGDLRTQNHVAPQARRGSVDSNTPLAGFDEHYSEFTKNQQFRLFKSERRLRNLEAAEYHLIMAGIMGHPVARELLRRRVEKKKKKKSIKKPNV